MGDNLAEQLYLVFCANSGLVPGSGDVPNWASMPIAQREIWESIAEEEEEIPLTEAQRLDLQRRVAAYEANPKAGSSWEEVKARLLQ